MFVIMKERVFCIVMSNVCVDMCQLLLNKTAVARVQCV